ncbi:hypothetical protein FHETE_9984 [Fusarium heterosporum]|uniref:Uncharacterized protein n=1 Tax=Fusarium heterosporum TaxID=42747 RepID=A0A8H5SWL1_FUSHE|nr:hypothetical protein FHETE_9984 [Fusarium heterosporum]
MNNTKRSADEMSGTDGDDGRTSPRAYRRLEGFVDENHSSDEATTPTPTTSSKTIGEDKLPVTATEFKGLLLNGLPVHLMTDDFKNYLFYTSNYRLEEAKQDGASLDDITIGEDCLPVWPGRTWDPVIESLHDTIQGRLINHDEAQQAGRLGAAADQAIRFLYEEEDFSEPDAMGDEKEDDDAVLNGEDESDHDPVTEESSFYQFADANYPVASIGMESALLGSSDSDSDSSSESDYDFEDEFDDAISVDNLFDVEPYYPESDDESNIFHGAEVVGLPSQSTYVDLELHMVEGEDEIRDLPEMELCIDQEGYEELFGSLEALDVEIEGSQLICTGELFEEDEEMVLDGMHDGLFKDLSGGAVGEQASQVNSADEDIIDLMEENGDQNIQREVVEDIFRETEGGFVW